MPNLFDPLPLAGITLPNRVILSPMCQYSAEDGVPNDWHLQHLARYGAAGLGLIVTEATHVSAEGRITPGCLGLWNEAQAAAFARIIRAIRAMSDTPVGVQIAHAGRKASAEVPWKGGRPLADDRAWQQIAPSPLPHDTGWPLPREMSEFDIARVKAEFVASVRLALKAGFDLVELHGAHGYLIHSFLSPVSNQRSDRYGGSLENRLRFPLELFEAVREAWPRERALGMRITGSDYLDGEGWQIGDAVVLARALKDRGADFVDVSAGGVAVSRQKMALGPAYQAGLAETVRREAGITTFAVGMIVDPALAQSIVAGGRADAVMLGRGLLHDPFWAWRAADALGAKVSVPGPYLRGRHLPPEVAASA